MDVLDGLLNFSGGIIHDHYVHFYYFIVVSNGDACIKLRAAAEAELAFGKKIINLLHGSGGLDDQNWMQTISLSSQLLIRRFTLHSELDFWYVLCLLVAISGGCLYIVNRSVYVGYLWYKVKFKKSACFLEKQT